MLLYYIRHGDPVYNPDSLTPLGFRQAEAVGRRLALHGVDRVYTSTSTRAKQTAQPLCEMLKLTPKELDWCNEGYAWQEFTKVRNGERYWSFTDKEDRLTFTSKEMTALGEEWYRHPMFENTHFESGIKRVRKETHKFFEELGFKYDEEKKCYIKVNEVCERVALFAHQGFGVAFLSTLLEIPYPLFSTHFDLNHSSVTVIEMFGETEVVPRIVSLSDNSHLYKENLPTKFENKYYL